LELNNDEATRLFQEILDKVARMRQAVPPATGTS